MPDDQRDSTDHEIRLLGVHEIRSLLGYPARHRVRRLTRRPTFPEPVARLDSGKVWLADDIEAWIAEQLQPQRNASDNTDLFTRVYARRR